MTGAGPTVAPPGAAPALLFIVVAAGLAACSPAGVPGTPAPTPLPNAGAAASGEAGDAPYVDGSADGSGVPAGLEELDLGAAGPWRASGGDAAGPFEAGELEVEPAVAVPAGLEPELRAQFGSLFLDGATQVPATVLDEVARYVEMFHSGRARENFARWLAREGRYRDLILAELEAAGLPAELLYLAMLESGFNPTAVSRARAVGLWQFMRATGRQEGLRIDDWIDERRDPEASTRAAVAHLRMLHRELGDWALAAAAYNAGLGRVRRAQGARRAGYFELVERGRLPAETRKYVPLILAAGHVARFREHYGFGDVAAESPTAFATLRVPGRTRLSALARVSDVPLEELNALNPHLVRGAAPPGDGYGVRIPVGSDTAGVAGRLAALPLEERILPEYHEVYVTVKAGDSWWRIARKHGRTVAAVRALNPRRGDVIHPGQKILVERRLVTDAQLSAGATGTAVASATAAAAAPGHRHKVTRGETLTSVARKYGVRIADLVRWNDLGRARPLRIGEILVVAPES